MSGSGGVKPNPRERAGWMVKLGMRSGSQASIVLGEALRVVRSERGLTQKQAAIKAGVSDSIWATWETGKGLPGEQSWRLVARWLGKDESMRLMATVAEEAVKPGGGEPLVVKKKAVPPKAKAHTVPMERVPVPDGWGGWTEEPVEVSKNVVRGPDTEPVLAAVLACGLGDREKALLCAAVVAMAAGVGVEVEIRARV